ncbi:unnamed protein product [Lactuca virosa]|uniref:Uncharacterized protein n=1 Tax=Lactuca virosa TaxID=75947 RepID=A0AAU9NSK1_9ASTR|nr:unnamed protein product [Lactuca virosa]
MLEDEDKSKMSFVMPSKYGFKLPLPKKSVVTIKEMLGRTVAVVAFSGFVTDEDVVHRESTLRNNLKSDSQYKVKSGASVGNVWKHYSIELGIIHFDLKPEFDTTPTTHPPCGCRYLQPCTKLIKFYRTLLL